MKEIDIGELVQVATKEFYRSFSKEVIVDGIVFTFEHGIISISKPHCFGVVGRYDIGLSEETK